MEPKEKLTHEDEVEYLKSQNQHLLARIAIIEQWKDLREKELALLNFFRLGIVPNTDLSDQTNDENVEIRIRVAIDLMSPDEIVILHRNMMKATSLLQFEINKEGHKRTERKKDRDAIEKVTEIRGKPHIVKRGAKKLTDQEKAIGESLRGFIGSKPKADLYTYFSNMLQVPNDTVLQKTVDEQFERVRGK